MIALIEEHRAPMGVAPTCAALGVARATFYRHRRHAAALGPTRPRRRPRQALSPPERDAVLALLHDERFVDLPPAQVWAVGGPWKPQGSEPGRLARLAGVR